MKIKVLTDHCTLCGACIKTCPVEIMYIKNNQLKINHSQCIQCKMCLIACQYKALTL